MRSWAWVGNHWGFRKPARAILVWPWHHKHRYWISAVCGRFQLINGVLSLRQNPGQYAWLNAEQDYCVAGEWGRTGRGFILRMRRCGGAIRSRPVCVPTERWYELLHRYREAAGLQEYTEGSTRLRWQGVWNQLQLTGEEFKTDKKYSGNI